jgi:hypothetical protein
VSDTTIQNTLKMWITAKAIPPATPNRLYFVFTQRGTVVKNSNTASCQDFCGYHSHINKSLFYAVVPYHDCLACTTNLISFDAMTITASHELCEAITDPVPGGGWYNAIYGEVGDYPDRGKKIVLGYKVQTEFSNKVNKSV